MFVRVRPPDPHLESELDHSACLDITSQVSITVHCKPEAKVFTFDHVAGMETTQVCACVKLNIVAAWILLPQKMSALLKNSLMMSLTFAFQVNCTK